MLLAVAAPIGLFAIALAASGGDEDDIADPAPTWSRPTIPAVPTYTSEPLPTQTEVPSDDPTPGPTNTSDPQQQKNGVDYEQVAEANKLYQSGPIQSVSCRESGTAPASKDAIRTYYATVANCLRRGWPAPMTKAGVSFHPPTILMWTGSIDTPCGFVNGSVSFYCPPNETIYMEWSGDVKQYTAESSNEARAYARMGATHTVVHEYGHHIQNLVGIMRAYSELRYEAASQDKQLELSRRVELQASCLGDAFLGANQSSYPISGINRETWLYLVEHSGDNYNPEGVRDHGDKQSHAFWAKRGFQAESPNVCNTFTASPEQVY
ncbi:neutral zinc metallopeptidase [Flindersiella endophytica]